MISEGLLATIAREQTGTRTDLFEDALQEARIAAWRVQADRPDASPRYVAKAVRRAALGVTLGRPMTGAPRHQGRKDAADTALQMPEHFDAPAAVTLDGVAESLTVRDAVRALPEADREIVFLRFWRDLPAHETGRVLGRPRGTIESAWHGRIRPQLREALGDLAA